MIMNPNLKPLPDGNYHKQRRTAEKHIDAIIQAFRQLGGSATSGELKTCIEEKVVRELEEFYELDAWNKVGNNQSRRKEIEEYKMVQRTIQEWLPKLKKQGLVTKGKRDVYSLTKDGWNLDILADVYGRMLISELINLQWFETREKNISEFIKRAGSLILYIFISNMRPTSSPIVRENENSLNWIKDAVSTEMMFLAFQRIFTKHQLTDRKQQSFFYGEDDYNKLLHSFKRKFPKYYKSLEKAEQRFLHKVHNPQSGHD